MRLPATTGAVSHLLHSDATRDACKEEGATPRQAGQVTEEKEEDRQQLGQDTLDTGAILLATTG